MQKIWIQQPLSWKFVLSVVYKFQPFSWFYGRSSVAHVAHTALHTQRCTWCITVYPSFRAEHQGMPCRSLAVIFVDKCKTFMSFISASLLPETKKFGDVMQGTAISAELIGNCNDGSNLWKSCGDLRAVTLLLPESFISAYFFYIQI